MGSFIEKVRREQIINTTIQTIAEKGYSNTSIGEIAKQANISKGVVTYYFKSKDLLIRKVMLKVLSGAHAHVMEQVAKETTALGKLLAYIDALLSYWSENDDNYRVLTDLWRSFSANTEKNKFNRIALRKSRTFLGNIIREGVDNGEFPEVDVKLVAFLIQGVMDGALVYWVIDKKHIDLAQVKRGVASIVKDFLLK